MVEKKALFGGAIVADFPDNFIDVSDVRQVPDNQEVFLRTRDDVSVIIEILQAVPEPSDVEAVKFHFEALAHDNDAVSSTMHLPIAMHNNQTNQPTPIVLRGSQRICKLNTTVPDDVDILIALFRVRGKCADLVVSESIPRGSKDGGGELAVIEFNSLVSSLRIIDYNLFC